MNLKNEDKLYSWLLVLAMLFWGGGWTAYKILTVNVPMDIIIFWRFFLMSLAFIPILYFFNKPIILNAGAIKYVLGSSVLNIAFMASSYIAVKHGLAGAGSVIITSLSPLLTFIIVALFYSKAILKRQYVGLFLGIIGGFVILELNNLDQFFASSNIYFTFSALIWAFVTIFSQRSHAYIHPIHYSFFISIVATIASFIYAFDSNLLSVFEQDYTFWLALIYLAIFGQTIATTIFFMASGKLGSQKTSSFMFLVPIFALFSAWLVLDEEIQLHIVVGGFISIIAVYFINKKID